MSRDYLLGLATLPALAAVLWLLLVIVVFIASGPRWCSHECMVCHFIQRTEDHPRWPWWLWKIDEARHHRTKRQCVREYQGR